MIAGSFGMAACDPPGGLAEAGVGRDQGPEQRGLRIASSAMGQDYGISVRGLGCVKESANGRVHVFVYEFAG